MSEKNVQIVKRFFETAAKGDISGARAVLDPNIEWVEPEVRGLWFSGTHRGAEGALKEVVAATFDNVDNFSISIDEYLDAGENVIALGTFHGNAKAAGKEFRIPACFISTVRGDKIVRFRTYHNTAMWLEVVGQPVA